MAKVCVIFGTESGGSERHAKRLSKAWTGVDFDASKDFMSGDAAAKKGLGALGAAYDFLVVVTSSYGDGDPPSNYTTFLTALYAAEDKPLAGCQHCVLGFGSTDYETFQNCPRLTDKLLGECGSTRAAMRAEIDDIDEAGGDELVKAWSNAVFEVLRGGAAAAPTKDVCAWSEPDSTLLDKHDEMLVAAASAGDALPFLVFGALAAAGVAAYVAKFTNVFAAAEAA